MPLYQCANIRRVRLHEGRELVYRPDTGKRWILPLETVDLLSRCHTFQRIEDHRDARVNELLELHDRLRNSICEHFPEPQGFVNTFLNISARLGRNRLQRVHSTRIHRSLRELIDAGLMLSDSDFLRDATMLRRPNRTEDPITGVGIVSENDVERVLLNGLFPSEPAEVIVLNLSESSEAGAASRRLLGKVGKKLDRPVWYVGSEEIRAFVTRLADEGIPPEVPRFALGSGDGSQLGAARNALMLQFPGEKILIAHSPVEPLTARFTEGEFSFDSRQDPWETEFFESTTEAAGCSFATCNAVEQNARFLGRLASEFATTDDILNLEHIQPSFTESLVEGRSRVLVTTNGEAGRDTHGTMWQLVNRYGPRARTWKHAAFSRLVSRVTFTDTFLCGGSFIGLDNRSVLPPFSPIGNPDELFAQLLRFTVPNAVGACLPTAFARAEASPVPGCGSGWEMNNFLSALLKSVSRHARVSEGGVAVRRAGRELSSMAGMMASEFVETLRLHFHQFIGSQILDIEALLKRSGSQPDSWVRHVTSHISHLSQLLREGNVMVPNDVSPGARFEDRVAATAQLTSRYGLLLEWWPDVVASAHHLKLREVRLGCLSGANPSR
jgi:hypothetical protein